VIKAPPAATGSPGWGSITNACSMDEEGGEIVEVEGGHYQAQHRPPPQPLLPPLAPAACANNCCVAASTCCSNPLIAAPLTFCDRWCTALAARSTEWARCAAKMPRPWFAMR
jgi:hypothetical protein